MVMMQSWYLTTQCTIVHLSVAMRQIVKSIHSFKTLYSFRKYNFHVNTISCLGV